MKSGSAIIYKYYIIHCSVLKSILKMKSNCPKDGINRIEGLSFRVPAMLTTAKSNESLAFFGLLQHLPEFTVGAFASLSSGESLGVAQQRISSQSDIPLSDCGKEIPRSLKVAIGGGHVKRGGGDAGVCICASVGQCHQSGWVATMHRPRKQTLTLKVAPTVPKLHAAQRRHHVRYKGRSIYRHFSHSHFSICV